MSNTTAGLIALLAYLVFLYFLAKLLKDSNLGPGPIFQSIKELLALYRLCSRRHERIIVLLLFTPTLFRMTFCGLLATIALAGFGCIGAIFGWDIRVLKCIRQLLQDFYRFVRSFPWSSSSSVAQSATSPLR